MPIVAGGAVALPWSLTFLALARKLFGPLDV
jgi:hypothetical protein